MSRLLIVVSMSSALALVGCVAPAPKPNDPYYAPVLPRTPLPAAQNNGAIYQAGFETNLYDDRKAHRVGDIITITLNERTQASKNATSKLSKDSSANIGLGSLFGGAVSMANPLTGNSMNLGPSTRRRATLPALARQGRATACPAPSLSPFPKCCLMASSPCAVRSG
jgi:Flagellar basal body L-ring protein